MTPNELKALDLVRERVAVAGFAPTIREIASDIGVTVSGAHRIVDSLVNAGCLRRTPAQSRGLAIADLPDLRSVPTDLIAAELGRRGVTFASLDPRAPSAIGQQRTCAANTCGAAVDRGHLMCRQHWFVLPPALRDRIQRTNAQRDAQAFERAVTEARDLIDSGQWRKRA